MVFLSNYLVFKIVLAALGRTDYPVAGDLELKYDTANKIYLSGGSLDYVDDFTLWTTIGEETTSHVIPQSPRIDFNNETKLTGEATGNFGSGVSIDGDYLAITDSFYHSNDYGKVYIYHRSGTTWSLQNSFESATSSDYMEAVAISSDYVMAGVRYGDNADTNAGEVLVYKRSGTTWTNTQTLTASDAANGDHFGYSITIKGNCAVVGTGSVSGAYVFTLSNGTWSETQLLTTGTDSDLFGHFVNLSDTDLLIGARGVNSLKGTAYIYTNNGGTFTQQAQITPDDLVGTDWFGQTGDIFGDYVCVGAPSQNTSTGAAYIFKRSGTTWTQQQKLTASNSATNTSFGYGVHLMSDDTVIIGAYNDDAKGGNAGAAYLFQRTGDTWSEIKIIYPSDIGANDFFGHSISSSETDLVISGPTQDNATGNVYLFPYTKTRNFYINEVGKYSVDATIAGLKYKTNEVDVTSLNIPAKVVSVNAGYRTCAAITEDGSVYMWGSGSSGRLAQGSSDTNNKNTPVQVKGVDGVGFLSNIKQVSIGGTQVLALANDGTLYSWGSNSEGQLGVGDTTARYYPTVVPYTGEAISKVAAIHKHNLICTAANGYVYACGENQRGQIGNGSSGTNIESFTQVLAGDGPADNGKISGITHLSGGNDFSIVLNATTGLAYGFGEGSHSQLSTGDQTQTNTTPRLVKTGGSTTNLTGIANISCGEDFSYFLIDDGTVYASGEGSAGEQGDGANSDNTSASICTGLTGIVDILGTKTCGFARKSDGTLYVWGDNTHGQFANGQASSGDTHTPTAITSITGVEEISAYSRGENLIVRKSDGSVWCWGEGTVGNIGNGFSSSVSSPTQPIPGAGPSVDGKFNLFTSPSLVFDNYNKLSINHGLNGTSSKLFLGSNTYNIGALTSDLTIETQGLYRGLVYDTSSNVAYFNKVTVASVSEKVITDGYLAMDTSVTKLTTTKDIESNTKSISYGSWVNMAIYQSTGYTRGIFTPTSASNPLSSTQGSFWDPLFYISQSPDGLAFRNHQDVDMLTFTRDSGDEIPSAFQSQGRGQNHNSFQHVTIVSEDDNGTYYMSLYVNGDKIAKKSLSTNSNFQFAVRNFTMGHVANGSTMCSFLRPFLYDGTLSDADVKNVFLGKVPKVSGSGAKLKCYFPEGLTDVSGNGNDLVAYDTSTANFTNHRVVAAGVTPNMDNIMTCNPLTGNGEHTMNVYFDNKMFEVTAGSRETSSSGYGTHFSAANTFDPRKSSNVRGWCTSAVSSHGGFPHYLTVKFPEAKYVSNCFIIEADPNGGVHRSSTNELITGFTIDASTDGASWSTKYTSSSGIGNSGKQFDLTSPGTFQYWRLGITGSSVDYFGIGFWDIISNNFSVDGPSATSLAKFSSDLTSAPTGVSTTGTITYSSEGAKHAASSSLIFSFTVDTADTFSVSFIGKGMSTSQTGFIRSTANTNLPEMEGVLAGNENFWVRPCNETLQQDRGKSPGYMNNSDWTHYVYTLSPCGFNLYINGVLRLAKVFDSARGGTTGITTFNVNTTSMFNADGVLGKFKAYSNVLDYHQVTELYHADTPGISDLLFQPDPITFDGYNKLTLSGITNPTSKIHALPTGAESTTIYDIGTATNIYIDSAGTYTAEMKGSDGFALDSNVVGTVDTTILEFAFHYEAFNSSYYSGKYSSASAAATAGVIYSDTATSTTYSWGTLNSIDTSTSGQVGYSWTPTSAITANVLIVGGGGGGGAGISGNWPSAGGGGEVQNLSNQTISAGTYTIVVGNGGTAGGGGAGGAGTTSSALGTSAVGGGAGSVGTSGTSGSGNGPGSNNGAQMAGGGGDASVGGNASGSKGGSGGDGSNVSWLDGSVYGEQVSGQAYFGGGGFGGDAGGPVAGKGNGVPGTGGGGNYSGAGKSGIVAIRSGPSATYPSLTFDGFNKYTFTGTETGSTYKLKYGSNTYDLGTISTVYIANPGTYSAEIKGATNFGLSSNVVGTVASAQKNYDIQDQILDAGAEAGYGNAGDTSQGGYGNSIDMSADGTRMIVGNGHWTDSNGRARIYHLESGSWVLKQTWDGGTRMGSQVAMNEAGTRAFALYTGGGVKIWDYSSGAWDTSASGTYAITPGSTISTELPSVDCNKAGDVVIIGSGSAKTWVYKLSGGSWSQDKEFDRPGTGVAMNGAGTRCFMGHHTDHKVWESNYSGSSWGTETEIIEDTSVSSSRWPSALSTDSAGETLCILNNTSGEGAIYERASNGSWSASVSGILSTTEIYGTDKPGISYDGTMVLFGHMWNSGALSTGGHALLYTKSGSTWSLAQTLLNPSDSQHSDDYFGGGLALAKTTKDRFVVAALGDDNAGSAYGAIYTYTNAPTKLDFDGYNKLTFSGLESGSTSNVTFDGKTYSIGTATNIYISENGTYEAESKSASAFALTSNTVSDTPTQKTLLTPGLINTFDGNADSEQLGKNWDGVGGTLSMNSSGTLAVISAVTYSSSTGRVYLYEKGSDNTWSLKFTFTSPRSTGDQFGHDVAINSDGTRIFILSGKYNSSGHGRIHIYDGPTWSTTPTTTLEEPSSHNGFWARMCINSTGTKVAATGVIYPYSDSDGRVYIFTHDGTNWGTTAATLDNPSSGTGGEFGYAIQMNTDGTRMLIGETVNDEGGANIGRAYAYALESGTWTLKQDLAGHSVNERFGTRISMTPDGSRAVICAPLNDETVVDGGRVYIYDYDSSAGTWSLIQDIAAVSTTSTKGEFGFDAKINDSGTRILIGAPTVDDDGTNRGRAYVFDRQSDGSWTLTKTLNDSGQDSSEFGRSVGMDSTGNIMLIAAPKDDQGGTDRGRIYYYQGSGGSPSLTHDGYKLVVKNITPTSSTLKYGSNTYDIGTATNVYIKDVGTYTAESKNSTDFAFTSNVSSGTVKTIEPVITGGYFFGHALTYDGKLYGWGENSNGELGVGDSNDKTVPTLCTGITQGEVVSIWEQNKRGQSRWAKTKDGRIWVTGDHDTYALPGSSADFTTFTDVSADFGDYTLTSNNVVWASGGERATHVLMENGDVWSFGNDAGATGILGQGGSATSDRTPRKVTGISNVTKMASGGDLVMALDSSNVVWMWGSNDVGHGSPNWGPYNTPTNIMGTGTSDLTDLLAVDSETVTDIYCSYYSMFVLTNKGTVYGTGKNGSGQLGQGNTATETSSDGWVKIDYFTTKNITVNRLYVGGAQGHVFADTSDGWYCWGKNGSGNLALGDTTKKKTPVKWTNVSNIKTFGTGSDTLFAIAEDGKYYAWGEGNTNARGDADTGDISYPKHISSLPNILAPSFEFDGYDKVFMGGTFVYEFYVSVKAVGSSGLHYVNINQLSSSTMTLKSNMVTVHVPIYSGSAASMFDGSNSTYISINDPNHEVDTKLWTLVTDKELANLTFVADRPVYMPGWRITCNGKIVLNDTTSSASTTPSPATFTKSLSPSGSTKFTKGTTTYDVGKASIVTVSDPGTYDAQLNKSGVFSIESTTVPTTSSTGLYTWAFHHGNFDNAYGDGDILTARDNGRFYADTPAYTSASIGTITPIMGASSFVYKFYCTVLPGPCTGQSTTAQNTLTSLKEISSTTTTLTSAMYVIADSSYRDSSYDAQSVLFNGDASSSGGNYVLKSYDDGGLAVNRHMFTITTSVELLQLSITTHRPGYMPGWKIILNDTHTLVNETSNHGTDATPSPYTESYTFSSNYPSIAPTHGTTYTFAPPSGGLTANVLMVAGGGGGGGRAAGGGGGAGGLVYTAGTSLAQDATKTIVVGNGDSGGYGEAAQNGYDGKDTTFTGLTTADGGGGGGNSTDGTGVAGGSGGGGGGSGSGGAAASGSQGTAGGASSSGSYGGGGGGAGAAGSDYSGDYAGDGGIGKFFGTGSSFTDFGDEYGEGGYFAGGGAGGSNGAAGKFGGTPGRGGGGYGGNYYGYMGVQDEQHGGSQHGMVHTGSGGGGSGSVTRDQHPGYDAVGNGGVKGHGGRGGSGIVLIQTNVAPPNGGATAVVQVGNPRRRSLPPAVDDMGSEVNRWFIIDSQSMPTYKLPTHWYSDPPNKNGNDVPHSQGSHSLQKRADGGTSNVWYQTSGTYFGDYGTKMAQTVDAVFMPVEAQRYDILLSIGQLAAHDIQLEMAADGTARITRHNDSDTLLQAGTIECFTVGKWHHIALTVDSEHNAVGYVNGYPVVSTTYTSHYDVGSRSASVNFRVGNTSGVSFRKFLTYEVSTYNFHMSPKQVLQRAAEVGLGPKLEYDGLNTLKILNTEPGSSVRLFTSNVADTSNVYIVADPSNSEYTIPEAGKYYAEIKGTDTFTITKTLDVSGTFPLYQYPPIDGTTHPPTLGTADNVFNTWTISGAAHGNGQYQCKAVLPSGTTSANNHYNFLRNNVGSNEQWQTSINNTYPIALIIQLPSAKKIRKYRMFPLDHANPNGSGTSATPGTSVDPTLPGNGGDDATKRPKSWVFKGSNSGTSWTDLDTVTNKPISIYGDLYSIDSPASYQYYQVYITANNGGNKLLLGDIQLWGDA